MHLLSICLPLKLFRSTNFIIYPAALMRTFRNAPITAALAHKAPTPASETEFGLPVSAIAFITSMLANATCLTLNGFRSQV
jgi:hypothetical protein